MDRKQTLRRKVLEHAREAFNKRTDMALVAPESFAPMSVVTAVVNDISLQPGDVFYDLGCGDGRWLAEFAKRFPGIRCVGVEKNVELLERARVTIGADVVLCEQDLFETSLSDANAVLLYLFRPVMAAVAEKILRECQPGITVISVGFHIPLWKARRSYSEGGLRTYIYEVPDTSLDRSTSQEKTEIP